MKRFLLTLALVLGAALTLPAPPPPPSIPIVKDKDGNVLNPPVKFISGQIFIDGLPVGSGGGGGGGGGTTLSSLTLNIPSVLFSSGQVLFDTTTSDVLGTMALRSVPAGSFFGNPSGTSATPSFFNVATAKPLLGIDNVDNTSDAGKPISIATQNALNLKANASSVSNVENVALSTWPGDGALITLGTVTTGTWNATPIGSAYLPTLDGISAPTAPVSLNGQKITNLADPTGANDAADKQYVDAVANAGPPHPAVSVASTGDLVLSGEQTIDGITTSTTRILVKNQTITSQNGIYITSSSGWTRATDADTGPEVSGLVFVLGGTAQAGITYGVTTPQPITLGTTGIAYTATGSNLTYSAGTGLTLSSTTFSLATRGTNSLMGNNTGSASTPLDLNASQVKTFLSISNVENTALSTWPGTANITTLGTITTGSIAFSHITGTASSAQLGSTTVGQNLLTMTNPAGIRFMRLNGDSSVTQDTASAFVTDIGAEPALGNPSFSGQVLSSTTGGTRSFISKENPLTINAPLTRSGDSIGMNVGTDSVNGYITSADHTKLTSAFAVSPQTVLASTCTGTNPCTLTINAAANPPINRVILNSVLATPLVIVLPPSSNYGAAVGYEPIQIEDQVGGAQASFGITVKPLGGDTLDGANSTTGITLPRGASFARLEANGSNKWATTPFYATSFKSLTDPTRFVNINVDGQAQNNPTIFTPATAGNGVSVVPLQAPPGQFFNLLGTDGSLGASFVTPSNLSHGVYPVGDNNFTVTNDGTIDTIPITTALTPGSTRTYTIPEANKYSDSDTLAIVDTTGSLSTSTIARLNVAGSGTINGGASIDITQPWANRQLVANAASDNWSISIPSPSGGLSLDGWHAVTVASGTATINTSSAVDWNLHIVNMSGATSLSFPTIAVGQKGIIKFRDSTGGHTITLPNGWKGPTTEQVSSVPGTIATSAGTNVEDEWKWNYDGTNGNKGSFTVNGKAMAAATPPPATVHSDTGPATDTASTPQGDTNGDAYIATSFVACGSVGSCLANGTTYTIARVDLKLVKTGLPTYNGFVSIWSDTGADKPSAQIGSESAGVGVASYSGTSPGAVVSFTGITGATVSAGTKYWIVYRGDRLSRTGQTDLAFPASATVNADAVGGTTYVSPDDVGLRVSGTHIPNNTSINAVNSSSQIVLTATPTNTVAENNNLTYGPGNVSKFTSWRRATVTGPTSAIKTATGSWQTGVANVQMMFDTYTQ